MTTSIHPLLILGEARIQNELRRAAVAASDAAAYHRKVVRLTFICVNDFLIGLAIIVLSIHMFAGDLARVVFYIGLIRALCGPMWTVLLSLWLEENGY